MELYLNADISNMIYDYVWRSTFSDCIDEIKKGGIELYNQDDNSFYYWTCPCGSTDIPQNCNYGLDVSHLCEDEDCSDDEDNCCHVEYCNSVVCSTCQNNIYKHSHFK